MSIQQSSLTLRSKSSIGEFSRGKIEVANPQLRHKRNALCLIRKPGPRKGREAHKAMARARKTHVNYEHFSDGE